MNVPKGLSILAREIGAGGQSLPSSDNLKSKM
jgi:hypothetical protein